MRGPKKKGNKQNRGNTEKNIKKNKKRQKGLVKKAEINSLVKSYFTFMDKYQEAVETMEKANITKMKHDLIFNDTISDFELWKRENIIQNLLNNVCVFKKLTRTKINFLGATTSQRFFETLKV